MNRGNEWLCANCDDNYVAYQRKADEICEIRYCKSCKISTAQLRAKKILEWITEKDYTDLLSNELAKLQLEKEESGQSNLEN